ncbi:hypothetical protein P154DRAFT_526247 [Amniculicola lignicola CBS 123094]|uniref:Uncharacterized protein n=1 Tax=Amniculicola lignicola CBS 123094 TaxID=1392246 RepID=A0A6A5W5Z9_9PLEO|nr:hypothetical protein P154DRAFT_526247 [Amniculicola lignicola CBS 123094]
MPTRSVAVTFDNNTDETFNLLNGDLDGGEWTVSPPQVINPRTTITFSSESDGFLTGTEGTAHYVSAAKKLNVILYWNNPLSGGNDYRGTLSDHDHYQLVSTLQGGGNNSSMHWVLTETSTSGDGIPDKWKRDGVSIVVDAEGTTEFINLPAMGARVDTPDIFVQVDRMAGDSTHDHNFSDAAIRIVVEAFKNSPWKNAAGEIKGINLHVDAGRDSIMDFQTGAKWGDLSRSRIIPEDANFGTGGVNDYSWQEFNTVKTEAGGFLTTGREQIFHYCIFAHQLSNIGNSGIARAFRAQGAAGSDFIVSLGASSTDLNVASTFMHELGHNLGLRHGGNEETNRKPNYLSIMSYMFQFPRLVRGTLTDIVDYSRQKLPDLDENSLNEQQGLGADAADQGTWRWSTVANMGSGGFVFQANPPGNPEIDWDDSGPPITSTLTHANINNDSDTEHPAGKLSVLTGHNDWEHLFFKGGAVGGYFGADRFFETPGGGGASGHENTSAEEEMNPTMLGKFRPIDRSPPTTTASMDPPPNAAGWNNSDVLVTLNATDDESGVSYISYSLDGAEEAHVLRSPATVVVSGDGSHTLNYWATDLSGNRESPRSLDLLIDSTPPEAIISYSPSNHTIVVQGVDSLSGSSTSPVAPTLVTPAIWRVAGADTSEVRVYKVHDYAGNWLELSMQIRCQRNEYELNVTKLQYSQPIQERTRLVKNTISFRRVMPGKCCNKSRSGDDKEQQRCTSAPKNKCILAVLQRISVEYNGKPAMSTTLQSDWDILHDDSNITMISGPKPNECVVSGDDCGCGCKEDNGKDKDKDSTREDCLRVCGLWRMKIKTSRGGIDVDATDLQDARSTWKELHSIAAK